MLKLFKKKFNYQNKKENNEDIILLIIASGLIGIWNVSHTIALRNILLLLGLIYSLYILIKIINNKVGNDINKNKIDYSSLIPLILIILMVLWVLIHYFFFRKYDDIQLKELSSTWLRIFIGIIIAITVGLIIRNNKNKEPLLWVGSIISFIFLTYQHVKEIVKTGSIFTPVDFDNYIFWAKYTGVLAGALLIAGALATILQTLNSITSAYPKKNQKNKSNISLIIYSILGIILPVYSFIFIFQSKNGKIITVILILIFTLHILKLILKKELKIKTSKIYLISLGIAAVITAIIIGATSKYNHGWAQILEDSVIALQNVEYHNWKTTDAEQYPKRDDGTFVKSNTYERVSWAKLGIMLISENIYGSGITRSLSLQAKESGIEFEAADYTHSGWIDLGLAYGLPGLVLLPTALIIMLIQSRKNNIHKYTINIFGIMILLLYLIGEYAFKQSIEILFFFCSYLAILNIKLISYSKIENK